MKLTVFGSAAAVPGSAAYVSAMKIGELAAREGWIVLCGAYGGVMEAAARGATSAGGRVVGYALPGRTQVNSSLSEAHVMPSYGARLDALLSGDAFVFIVPDGIGTLAELLVVLNHNKKLWSPPKRLTILEDATARPRWWESVVGLLRQLHAVSDADFARVTVSASPETAIAALRFR